MRPVRLCRGCKLFCSLFSSGSFSYLCSCYNSCVRVVSNLFYYNSGIFYCYYRIGVSCLGFLVRARNHCYAEYNGESENYFLHFGLGLK